jgi:hypothetical protein
MPADRTRRTTTSREAAEAAFKAATTKPAELPPKRPTIPNTKELVASLPYAEKFAQSIAAAAPARDVELVVSPIRDAARRFLIGPLSGRFLIWSLKPRHARGLLLLSLCIGGPEPGGRPRRWSVGHDE